MFKVFASFILLLTFLNADSLGFKDIKLGMTEKELKDIGGVSCLGNSGDLKRSCFTQKYSTVAGVSIIQPVYIIFYSDTVDSIFLQLDTSNFERIANAYKTKYGEPSRKSNQILQSRMRTVYESKIYVWNLDGGNILKIEERAGEKDKMSISFISPHPK